MTLVTIRPGLTLEAEAADSWLRAEAELGRQIDVNRSLADWGTQYRLWLDYTQGRSKVIALHPNDSNHCKGLAVDSDDGYNPQVVALLRRHGWVQTVYRIVNGVRRLVEPWHFDRDASKDQYLGTGYPAGAGATPLGTITARKGGTIMDFIVEATSPSADGLVLTGRTFGVSLNAPITILAADEVAALKFSQDNAEHPMPFRFHEWPGDRIRKLMETRGYYPWSADKGATNYTTVKY